MSGQWSVRRLALASLIAGLVAAIVEMLFVLPIQWFLLHHSPVLVFQSIAAGSVGKAAFQGGMTTAAEGAAWHTLISVGAAAVYVAAASRFTAILDRPALYGILFGVVVYVVMTFVVIPLSAIGFTPPKLQATTAMSIAIHLFAFGLPIGLVVSRMLGAAQPASSTV